MGVTQGFTSAVYEGTNNRMTVFAGVDTSGTALGDTQVLVDLGGSSYTSNWASYSFCTSPDNRAGTAYAYASGSNRMIKFGGQTSGGVGLNDTWVLTNANGIPSTTVSSVTVSSETTSVCKGYTLQLLPDALDSSGTSIPNFLYYCTSSNTSIATVTE